jgi:hypothetical protein
MSGGRVKISRMKNPEYALAHCQESVHNDVCHSHCNIPRKVDAQSPKNGRRVYRKLGDDSEDQVQLSLILHSHIMQLGNGAARC